ncbi:hypothetical protein RhiJN_07290 [Ceratobasidium sp. AG-Ba]|nr:hypothetical protein RhiJN_07290 [Ceratobasidium sp. AG-Ba]
MAGRREGDYNTLQTSGQKDRAFWADKAGVDLPHMAHKPSLAFSESEPTLRFAPPEPATQNHLFAARRPRPIPLGPTGSLTYRMHPSVAPISDHPSSLHPIQFTTTSPSYLAIQTVPVVLVACADALDSFGPSGLG